MAVYRERYILQGLGEISPEMEKDLDLAYDLCEALNQEFPCEEIGRASCRERV